MFQNGYTVCMIIRTSTSLKKKKVAYTLCMLICKYKTIWLFPLETWNILRTEWKVAYLERIFFFACLLIFFLFWGYCYLTLQGCTINIFFSGSALTKSTPAEFFNSYIILFKEKKKQLKCQIYKMLTFSFLFLEGWFTMSFGNEPIKNFASQWCAK